MVKTGNQMPEHMQSSENRKKAWKLGTSDGRLSSMGSSENYQDKQGCSIDNTIHRIELSSIANF
jgi:hypothetical protein